MAYAANGVDFDGTNDWLSAGAGIVGASDSKVGSSSFWLRIDGGDDADQIIFTGMPPEHIKINRNTANKIGVLLRDADNSNTDFIDGSTSRTASSTWLHVLVSWDRGNDAKHFYINDADDLVAVTLKDSVVDLTQTDWSIGAFPGGSAKLNGCLADFWFTAEYIDFSVESNRRKFIDGSGNVVYLGSDGSTPTGSQPLVFLSGVTSDWHTNLGSGGGLTESGAIADCSTDPPAAAAAPTFDHYYRRMGA